MNANEQNSFNCQEESCINPFADIYIWIINIYSLCQEEAVIMSNRVKHRKYPEEILHCQKCGSEFFKRDGGTNQYCSHKCAMSSRIKFPDIVNCEICGKPFKPNASSTGKYCSIQCVGKARLGNNHWRFNEEDRKKICDHCGNEYIDSRVNPNRKYCSQKCYFLANTGTNHWYYNPDATRNGYPIEFNMQLKKYIRRRDNYRCQICNKTESTNKHRLDVHHINYNKSNNEVDNLISLCKSCHMRIHTNDITMQNLLNNIAKTNEMKIKKLV